jgi:hypothetical protein
MKIRREHARPNSVKPGMKIGIVIICLSAFPIVSPGRLVQIMSDEEMRKRADLVAVARPVSTRDTAEVTVLTNIGRQMRVLGRETKFQVQRVEKGDTNLTEFVLHHCRLADPGLLSINGPEFLNFAGRRTNDSFLVYLVLEGHGRFAPVSGQTDPAPSVVYVSKGANSAVERFAGKWRFEDGLMGETDTLELAGDHTFHWEHWDSAFQPPAVTRLTGTWEQHEFAYVTLTALHRVDHQGERVLVDKDQKERIDLCLTEEKKLKVFEGAAEFTRVGGMNSK